MAGQIIFFEKNIIDLDNDLITITATDAGATDDGQDYVNFLRNRNNNSAWMTTGSADANNTELEVDFAQSETFTEIILVKHNFKAYTIQYWNGSSYVDFSTPINVSGNSTTTTRHTFTNPVSSKIKIIVTATFVVDEDKSLCQLLVTNPILTGQLEGWPIIQNPIHSTNKIVQKMLSGKKNIVESLGSFEVQLSVSSWRSDNDLDLMENIYFKRQGVLLWLCGGDATQFSTERIGYRLEDFYLVRPTSEYEPEYNKGLYKSGIAFSIKLVESVS